MKQEHINYAFDTLRKKNKLDEILYWLTEPEEYVLCDVVLGFKNGKTIQNVPIEIRNVIRKVLITEVKKSIKVQDEIIKGLE
jgi:hypothetical protein